MIPSFEQRRSIGMRLLAMGGDAPDTSGQNEAALASSKLSQQQFDWAKSQFEAGAPARQAAADRSNAISDAQLRAMQSQQGLADSTAARYTNVFQPLENQMVQDAKSYDTPAREEQAAAAAGAGVKQQFTAATAAQDRAMQRAGVNPSDGASMAAKLGAGYAQALGVAGAENQARVQTKQIGDAKLADVVNLGRGVATNNATNVSLASQLGNSSSGNAINGINALNSGNQVMQNGFSGAQSSLGNAASIYQGITNTQTAANSANASALGALGAAGTTLLSTSGQWGPYVASLFAGSDKNEKTDVRPASDEKALRSLRDTPVATWRYKDDSQYADGGREHVGPMAQDVQAAAGDSVAPGGKVIDLISANGVTMGAVRALDKKVTSIAKMMGGILKHDEPRSGKPFVAAAA